MIDLLPVLVKATATTRLQLKQWFALYPAGMPWSVVSDYCIGDVNKRNDVFSFVVIAPHDRTENICKYIAGVAPKDLKNTNKVPLGLVQYLTCEVPVTFSVSFVMSRDTALLRDYLSVEAMSALAAGAISLIEDRLSLYKDARDIDFHQSAIKRLQAFKRDLSHKGTNARLARHIHLVAAMVATLCNMLNQAVSAKATMPCPEPNYMAERNRDSYVETDDSVVCENCDKDYEVLIVNSFGGADVSVDGGSVDVNFDVPYYDEDDRDDERTSIGPSPSPTG
nr:hypothetical protein [uncultured Limnohabitans sp.]